MTSRPTSAIATTDAVIAIRGLHKRYGDHEAVRGIDLEVRRGEILARGSRPLRAGRLGP